jgi:hypothetical protein
MPAIPAKAVAFTASADPYDLVEWVAECADKILEPGEAISTYTLNLHSEAIALGVSIRNDGAYVPLLVDANKSIQFWIEVDPSFREDPAFQSGFKVAIVILVNTESVPPRRRQRTWVATLEQL